MNLTFNGQNTFSGITLTGVPNIITLTSSAVTGTKSQLTIIADDNITDASTMTINDVTITNFKGDTPEISAFNITKALRASGLVNYTIRHSGKSIYVQALEVGSDYSIKFNTNITGMLWYIVPGTSTDEFSNGIISLDLYRDQTYVTTLEKTYYRDHIDFNISDWLYSISQYDYLTPYRVVVHHWDGKDLIKLGEFSAKSAIGYMCNQGQDYLQGSQIATNFSRENSLYYTFFDSIPLTIYSDTNTSVLVKYKDNSGAVIKEQTENVTCYNGVGKTIIILDSFTFKNTYYIDIVYGEQVMKFKVIKPVDATSRCLRIYYHNSYGGVSFFDFTGNKTEEHKLDNEIYQKNIYDYYKSNYKERDIVYNKSVQYTVTVKSHLMEREGIWQFNDLLRSSDCWTSINGVDYKIIVSNVRVDEVQTGVWEATVVYDYSLL